MSLAFLKLFSRSDQENGIIRYLLIPDLSSEFLNTQMSELVILNLLCYFRRTHPYVASFMYDVEFYMQDNSSGDFEYYRSLPDLPLASGYSAKYVGLGDISSFIPRGEDESLLFLPQQPTGILPGWPKDILDLKGIYTSQCDDFTTIETVDEQIINLLDSLLKSDQ